MPLCPQITNTPITVSLTADFTVTDVVPVLPANTEQLDDAIVLIDGKTKAYYQASQPTSGMTEGDLWFDTDDGFKLYFYTGTAWTSVQDTSIAAAQSAATAAQTTADGKNRIYRQTSQPTGGTYVEGDLWFDTDDANKMYRFTSGSWTAFTLGDAALASLSATKLTAGTIDASVITVSNLDAGNITTGTLSAARIAAASIDATKIVSGSITATQISSSYVYAGSITAGQITAGTLTGFTVQTSSGSNAVILNGSANALQIKANTTVVSNMLNFSSTGTIWHHGSTPDSTGGTFPQARLTASSMTIYGGSSAYFSANAAGNLVEGSTQATGTWTFTNTVTANSDLNLGSSADLRVPLAFSTTTANAATVWISSSGQFRRSTASSERYKTDIVNLVDVPELNPKALYDLPVRAFRFREGYLPETDDRFGVLVPGFIAEEMDAIYPAATDYADGVETWNDRMIIPAMLALIQDQEARIKALEGE